jgi:prepilin-type N-terminal cleavage/methylation domain-containing protein
MLDRIREARKNESGFTLIELLIVIVILGVLAGIVVFAVGAFNNNGKASACKADKKNVEIAVEAYYAKNTKYPTTWTQLITAGTQQYLKEKPSTANYTLAWSSTDGSVTATAVGTNGVSC